MRFGGAGRNLGKGDDFKGQVCSWDLEMGLGEVGWRRCPLPFPWQVRCEQTLSVPTRPLPRSVELCEAFLQLPGVPAARPCLRHLISAYHAQLNL